MEFQALFEVGPLDALLALDTTPGPVSLGCLPRMATVLLRYCYGISPVSPRCCSHVDAINMGDTPGIYRSNTVAIPWRHHSDTGPGVVSSALEGLQGADPS